MDPNQATPAGVVKLAGLQRYALSFLARRSAPLLRAHGLLRAVKTAPVLVGEISAERVLVLAPHPDDEAIGCGGTLAKHQRAGASVHVLFMTDGGSRVEASDNRSLEERIAHRRGEAKASLALLGIRHATFGDVPDGELNRSENAVKDLANLIERFDPDLIYVPSFLEQHLDHRAANVVLLRAVGDTTRGFTCCGYEVSAPLVPNWLVDISDVAALKRQAIDAYSSQLTHTDYRHAALGLNAFRAGSILDLEGGFAEAFIRLPWHDYRTWCESTLRDL